MGLDERGLRLPTVDAGVLDLHGRHWDHPLEADDVLRQLEVDLDRGLALLLGLLPADDDHRRPEDWTHRPKKKELTSEQIH